ncbi:MAG: restriction endonuclease [Gammaproteobacteria bacterium]
MPSPYESRRKGADGGIDGIIYFQDEKSAAKKIIVSVKAGENVGLTMVKDLIATVAGEGAQIGLFITLAPPTKSMIAEAVRTGYYSSATGQSFPKIQILTIESLLDGSERPSYPDLAHGGLTFKQTKREKTKEEQLDLPGL